MSDVALPQHQPRQRYRSNVGAVQTLGRPAGRNSLPEVQHPVPSHEPQPWVARFNTVQFRESGFWPVSGGTPEWYRQIRGPVTTLEPRTVGNLPGGYIRPDFHVYPGTLLLTGNRTGYRLYLYLGFCIWYPLYLDHDRLNKTQYSRRALARIIHCIQIAPLETTVAGCLLRSMLQLGNFSVQPFCTAAEELFGEQNYRESLTRLQRFAPCRSIIEQIAASGPLNYALLRLECDENGESELSEWLRPILSVGALPTPDSLDLDVVTVGDDSDMDESDLRELAALNSSGNTGAPAEPTASFRRVVLFNADAIPEL